MFGCCCQGTNCQAAWGAARISRTGFGHHIAGTQTHCQLYRQIIFTLFRADDLNTVLWQFSLEYLQPGDRLQRIDVIDDGSRFRIRYISNGRGQFQGMTAFVEDQGDVRLTYTWGPSGLEPGFELRVFMFDAIQESEVVALLRALDQALDIENMPLNEPPRFAYYGLNGDMIMVPLSDAPSVSPGGLGGSWFEVVPATPYSLNDPLIRGTPLFGLDTAKALYGNPFFTFQVEDPFAIITEGLGEAAYGDFTGIYIASRVLLNHQHCVYQAVSPIIRDECGYGRVMGNPTWAVHTVGADPRVTVVRPEPNNERHYGGFSCVPNCQTF